MHRVNRTSEKYRYLITKGIMISRLAYHNQMLQSNTSRLNGLRWTTHQKLICREPTRSGRTSEPVDNLWVTTDDRVHSQKGRINKITGKSQRILMNAARHMDLTIMQAGEKGHEHVATEDFGRPSSNSESYRNPWQLMTDKSPIR